MSGDLDMIERKNFPMHAWTKCCTHRDSISVVGDSDALGDWLEFVRDRIT